MSYVPNLAGQNCSMMNWMLERSESGSRPRRPSFAPVSITSTETGCRRSQSIRRRAKSGANRLRFDDIAGIGGGAVGV